MHGIGRIGAILGAFYGSLILVMNSDWTQIFFVLAIPAAISFFALLAKVMYENHQVTLKVEPITQLEIS